MIAIDESAGSANLAMWYRDVPVDPGELKRLKGKITKESWKYLLGKMSFVEKNRRGDDELIQATSENLQIGSEILSV